MVGFESRGGVACFGDPACAFGVGFGLLVAVDEAICFVVVSDFVLFSGRIVMFLVLAIAMLSMMRVAGSN